MSDKPKILAISSAGGHWVQLQRLRAAWEGCDAVYVTTKEGYRDDLIADAKRRGQPEPRFYRVVDANRWQKFRLLRQLVVRMLCLFLCCQLNQD